MNVIEKKEICNLFTVTVDKFNTGKKIGDIITDEMGRRFIVDSVAMLNRTDITTFVLTPLNGERKIGDILH